MADVEEHLRCMRRDADLRVGRAERDAKSRLAEADALAREWLAEADAERAAILAAAEIEAAVIVAYAQRAAAASHQVPDASSNEGCVPLRRDASQRPPGLDPIEHRVRRASPQPPQPHHDVLHVVRAGDTGGYSERNEADSVLRIS
ncbi:MAG: hypothetical protein NVS3B21_13470 [Acidimicrobiales bacterium]